MKRVLIVNPFGLGDCLFLSPVFRALKDEARAERIVLLLGSRTQELFRGHRFVDETIAIDRDLLRAEGLGKTLLFLKGLVARLAREKFDLFVDVSLSREYAFAAKFLLGIPKRIGFDYHRRGLFLTDRLVIPEGYRWKHVMEYYRDLLGLLGLEAKTQVPEIFLSKNEIKNAKSILSGAGISQGDLFTVLVPGGGESWGKDARFKRWPAHHFSKLLALLASDLPTNKVVILGSQSERELGNIVTQNLEGFHVVNWMGARTLRESLSVLSLSALVVTNDGGLCHAARAFHRPLIAIYGPVAPEVYGPYPKSENELVIHRKDLDCQPCYRSFRYNSSCSGIECLNQLKPEEVARMISEAGFLRKVFTQGEIGERK